MGQNASPQAQNGLKNFVSAYQMVHDHFWKKRVFDPFLTQFWCEKGPFSRHFGIFHGTKRVMAQNGPKILVRGPQWSRNNFGKNPFCSAPGTLVDPPLAPTVRRPGCPHASPSDHLCGGLGVSLRDSEAWKPQKVGGCGWTRCPRNSNLSHIAQDTARSWCWAV